ncbi:MAG: hypothetical protein M3319_16570, partial [Actinomycetota bacterium]|nr:hypothetical protein [Actinomycetota bacterium]
AARIHDRHVDTLTARTFDEQHVELLTARTTMLVKDLSLGTFLNSVIDILSETLKDLAGLSKGRTVGARLLPTPLASVVLFWVRG